MQYDFEWDLRKARVNRTRHEVTFEEAATVFQDPNMITLSDAKHEINEAPPAATTPLCWSSTT